jgi:hypothetical protein
MDGSDCVGDFTRKKPDLLFSGFAISRIPNADGQLVNTPVPFGDFPIGKSEHPMSRFTCTTNSRTPNSEATCPPLVPGVPHCHVLFGTSRIADPRYKFLRGQKPRNAEPRNPEVRLLGIARHLSLSRSTVPVKSGNRRSRFQKV